MFYYLWKGIGMENNGSTGSSMSGNVHGGTYFITVVGAAVYFLQNASTFWDGFLGILKACVWPAFVVYKVLEMLNL